MKKNPEKESKEKKTLPTFPLVDNEHQCCFYDIPQEKFSNFYPSKFTIDSKEYPTVEHYYQSKKSKDPKYAEVIRKLKTVKEAHTYGRLAKLVDNWEEIKIDVGYIGIKAKFEQNEDLKKLLLGTCDKYLVNLGTDMFWDMCVGDNDDIKGENNRGKTLMKVREELKKEKT